jgi:DNA primase
VNVKIVLLPDGEDPDSYSKKVSNEEFIKYIREHETDFIRFKTSLLMDEAAGDPVKKANLIRDIVHSIAVIPETITRTVYIKECSNQMGLQEAILYNEVNKMRQQRSFQDRNRFPDPQDLPIPPMQVTKQIITSTLNTEIAEREIIRLLMKYGSTEFERHINKEDGKEEVIAVSDYIVREIISDDLHFDDPVYASIFEEYRFAMVSGTFIAEKGFVKHPDPAVSRLAADLLSEPHTLSKIYSNKQTYVETEDMKLKDIVPDVILVFKSGKIKMRIKEIHAQIKVAQDAGDIDKAMELMKKNQALSAVLKILAQKLGDRII